MTISTYNGRVYMHISDKSKAFVNGVFDVTKCKNVTLGSDEVVMLATLIGHFDIYQNILSPPNGPPSQNQQQNQQQDQQQSEDVEMMSQLSQRVPDVEMMSQPGTSAQYHAIPVVSANQGAQYLELCTDGFFANGDDGPWDQQ